MDALQDKWLAEDEARDAAPAAPRTPRLGISRQEARAMVRALCSATGAALGQALAERDAKIAELERRVAAAELTELNLRLRLGELERAAAESKAAGPGDRPRLAAVG